MIYSNEGVLSDGQAIGGISTVSGVQFSNNVLDLGETQVPINSAAALGRDVGQATRIPFRAQVTATFVADTNATFDTGDTLYVELIGTDTEPGYDSTSGNVASVSNETVIVRSPTVEMSDLDAGFVFPIQYITRGARFRFLLARYTLSSSGATKLEGAGAGSIFSGVVCANEEWYT